MHAVEWLSQDVIAAGQKNSKIFLHDLRSGGSATRLQHNDAVMEMKQMDEHRLVAAGPTSVCDAVCSSFFSSPHDMAFAVS